MQKYDFWRILFNGLLKERCLYLWVYTAAMPTRFLLLLFTSMTVFCQTKKQEIKPQPLNPADYPFYKAMTEVHGGKTVYKKEFQYLDSLNLATFTYKSFDGLNITGFMAAPKKSGKYPVVIYNRGGNGSFGTVTGGVLCDFLGKIAREGYIVIGSQLRGSGGSSEGFDEFGGKDVNDALSLLEVIDGLPNADKNKIATLGWSRGVMTNFLMLKKTDRIKTNIAIAGPANLATTHRPEMFAVYRQRIPSYAKDSVAVLRQRSPLFAIDSIANKKMTHLIIYGNADDKVLPGNAVALHKKLIERKFTAKIVAYKGEGHDLGGVRKEMIVEMTLWLRENL